MTSTLIVNQNSITGPLDIVCSGHISKQIPQNAKIPTSPYTTVRITTNRLHRPNKKTTTIDKPSAEEETHNTIIISTETKPQIKTNKRKPKHTRMQPMTGGQRHGDKQTLAQMRNSIHTCGIIHTPGIDLSKCYNLASYIQYIGKYFIDVSDLPLSDTQERSVPSWQKEIQKAAKKLKSAEEELKSAKHSSLCQEHIDRLQENFDISQKNLYQLIARHQQSFNNPKDYTNQIRADHRYAKQLMPEKLNESLSLMDLCEPEDANIAEDTDTPIVEDTDTSHVSPKDLQLAWTQFQDKARMRRFKECVYALYGLQKRK